jgi:hypothetical protein
MPNEDKNAVRVCNAQLNMRNMIDARNNEALAIIEGTEDVNLYSTVKLREQEKKCETVKKIGNIKTTFHPTKVLFNPEN